MRYSDSNKAERKRRRLATSISNVTLPPIIAVVTFVLINYTVSNGLFFVTLSLLTTLFAALVPLSILVIWVQQTHSCDLDVPARVDRDRPLLIATVSYFIGTLVLLLLGAPALTIIIMFIYGAGTLVIFLINLRWKISIHTMSLSGATAMLLFVFGSWGLLLGLLLPPVLWSRIYLKKHTVNEVLAGAFAGFVLTTVALWLFSAYRPLLAS